MSGARDRTGTRLRATAIAGPSDTLHVVVPVGIDDPARPSGGNAFDRRICTELPAHGWTVREHPVPGTWPDPTPACRAALARLLHDLPNGSTVLVDGLIGSADAAVARAARRLRVVVLVHMPLAEALPATPATPATAATERAVLSAAHAVVTTSAWSRQWLIEHHDLPDEAVRAVVPGCDPGPITTGDPSGGRLLCAAAVVPAKGYDVLFAALAALADLAWTCTCVGSLDLDPGFVRDLTARAESAGITDRVRFTGPLTPTALDDARARADLLVSASRRESYGMAVAEGLARGIPAIVTDLGGHRESVGRTSDGEVPGLLVPAGDSVAVAHALRRWLTDAALRRRLRQAAVQRRAGLPHWPDAAAELSIVLRSVAQAPVRT